MTSTRADTNKWNFRLFVLSYSLSFSFLVCHRQLQAASIRIYNFYYFFFKQQQQLKKKKKKKKHLKLILLSDTNN